MTPIVDLRSDTVTRPTAAMREAMWAAPVGDDVFGDDPSVNALQDKLAALLGFEAALFMPTGTQSNLCGLMAHCGRGDEYIVGQMAHTYRYEGGALRCSAAFNPSLSRKMRAGKWRWPTLRPRSNPMTATSPVPACCAWKTPGTATPCPRATLSRQPHWRGSVVSRCTWMARVFSMRR